MIFYPPQYPPFQNKTIFLAGTIDNGNSEDWQSDFGVFCLDIGLDVCNPRRKDWNPDAKQEKNDPYFREQVVWELKCMNWADIVFFHFSPNSKSPVTLLELGLILSKKWGKAFIYCPPGFYRKGNVDITCEFHGIKVFESLEEIKIALKNHVNSLN